MRVAWQGMFLFRPAADETRPTPSREGNLLYSTLTASHSHLTFQNYPPRSALARWLGGLECCSAHQKVGGSSPAQGRDLGGMFSPNQGAYGLLGTCEAHGPGDPWRSSGSGAPRKLGLQHPSPNLLLTGNRSGETQRAGGEPCAAGGAPPGGVGADTGPLSLLSTLLLGPHPGFLDKELASPLVADAVTPGCCFPPASAQPCCGLCPS